MIELNKLISNFKLRNIGVDYFENLEDVKETILNLVPREASVGIGHSATLQKLDITKELIKELRTLHVP